MKGIEAPLDAVGVHPSDEMRETMLEDFGSNVRMVRQQAATGLIARERSRRDVARRLAEVLDPSAHPRRADLPWVVGRSEAFQVREPDDVLGKSTGVERDD